MKYRLLTVIIIGAGLISACRTQYDIVLEGMDAETKYEWAMRLYEQGKYQKAARMFESLSMLTQGTERDDTVQYYMGMSNYKAKDFTTAESNFNNFVSNYPASPFTEDVRFYILDCLYRSTYRYELDQTPSYKAITAISDFMIAYPENSNNKICQMMLDDLNGRIERKSYENAKIYYTMEDYKAARVAFKNVLKDNAEIKYREEILYYTAMSSYKYAALSVASKQKERFLQFYDDYLNFIGEYPESKYRKTLDPLYLKVKEKN